MRRILKNKYRDETGATLVNYALMVALVAVVSMSSMNYLADEVSKSFCDSASVVRDYTGESSANQIKDATTWKDGKCTGETEAVCSLEDQLAELC